MSKPSWDDAPWWAEWLAQDEDGCWVFFHLKPNAKSLSGKWDGYSVTDDFEEIHGDDANQNWKNTLEKRPKVKK